MDRAGLEREFRALVHKIAGKFYGPRYEDRVQAGWIGFWEAVRDFAPNATNRLSTFAFKRIEKAVREECRQFYYQGQTEESRADKWLFSHPGATADEVVSGTAADAAPASRAAADAAVVRQAGLACDIPYDTTEPGFEDDEVGVRPAYIHAVPAPKHLTACGDYVDYAALLTDRQDMERLRLIGRRAYALELVEKDRKRTMKQLTTLEFKREKSCGRNDYNRTRNNLSRPVAGLVRRAA
jgi:RNA polymerase sigma factor (sigma-70 family)